MFSLNSSMSLNHHLNSNFNFRERQKLHRAKSGLHRLWHPLLNDVCQQTLLETSRIDRRIVMINEMVTH